MKWHEICSKSLRPIEEPKDKFICYLYVVEPYAIQHYILISFKSILDSIEKRSREHTST